jgi:hypothetical protein
MGELLAERWFDLRRGTHTTGAHELDTGRLRAAAASDGVRYQGASPALVRSLLAVLPPEAHEATFLDYGCGKGRVLILAAEAGFDRLAGVECAPGLLRICERNLELAGVRRPPGGWMLHSLDATQFAPPQGPLVAFLYNPFRGETLRRVVRRLREHALLGREPLSVAYANPCELAPFLEARFEIIHTSRRRGRMLGVTMSFAGYSRRA